jgi:hypothetical protein
MSRSLFTFLRLTQTCHLTLLLNGTSWECCICIEETSLGAGQILANVALDLVLRGKSCHPTAVLIKELGWISPRRLPIMAAVRLAKCFT